MEIPFQRWYDALLRRRSRRLYQAKAVPPNVLQSLADTYTNFRPFDSVRAASARMTDDVFKGIIGAYGKIRGAPHMIAFIGDTRDRHVREKIGYYGEAIVLEATALGLGTCWVGKSFDRNVASSFVVLEEHEHIFAITPIGYAAERSSFEERALTAFGRSHARKPLGELASGLPENTWSEWTRKSLEAARLAPSAVNRQPWRFYVEHGRITISVDTMDDSYGISKRIDCGIAMLHIEIAALACGVSGTWEFLDPPRVAAFVARS